MKLIMAPIDVAASPLPTQFCWRGHLYEVETILETWTWRGRWWLTDMQGSEARDDKREYYLLMTNNGVMEIFRGNDGWMLSRISD